MVSTACSIPCFICQLIFFLSSNQIGGIDEAALDHLSLVTEMTKHIRVRASGGRTTASELGQFSPTFVWLLRVSLFEVSLIFFLFDGFDTRRNYVVSFR